MLEKVDWNKYGVVDGVARDPRCENCMVHCGYDPSGALSTSAAGHLEKPVLQFQRQAQALLRGPERQGLQRLFHRQGPSGRSQSRHQSTGGGGCGTGDTTQRDELLAKIAKTRRLDAKAW